MKHFFYLDWLVLPLAFFACTSSKLPEIIDKPIIFDEERTRLSLEYMREHYGIETATPVIDPSMIGVHWTAIPTFEGSYHAFYESKLPSSRTGIQNASALNVSVPYLIDRDGTIYQLMPDTLLGRHVIGLNHTAIGIENVGDGDQHPLTEEQYEANQGLIRYLAEKYDIRYVIGHHEYQRFRDHPLWLETDPNYLTEKCDPGDAFMERLHSDLSDLDLEPLPRKLEQGIRGQVLWLEGNLMPGVSQQGKAIRKPAGKGIQRTLYIYELTHRDAADYQDGFFVNVQEELVTKVETNAVGNFSVALKPEQYSVLVKENKGFFAGFFDGEGNLQPVAVTKDSVTQIEIKVDYEAAY